MSRATRTATSDVRFLLFLARAPNTQSALYKVNTKTKPVPRAAPAPRSEQRELYARRIAEARAAPDERVLEAPQHLAVLHRRVAAHEHAPVVHAGEEVHAVLGEREAQHDRRVDVGGGCRAAARR